MAAAVQPAQAGAASRPHEDGTPLQNPEKPINGEPRKPRPRRPNYHEIHAKPLPLDAYPLPAFIPHNPLSIVRIAIGLISQSIRPPTSHSVIHKAYFSVETQSIHVTDPASIRALWEQGFWGKGSLSRSEPQWLVAEKRRRGAEASKTSTEVTQSRREERKQFKLERAKAQREAIEQQLRQEGKIVPDATINELVEDATRDNKDALAAEGEPTMSVVPNTALDATSSLKNDVDMVPEADIQDLEHLQLTPEEAFFLTYVLGILEVVTVDASKRLSASYLLRLHCAQSAGVDVQESMDHLMKVYPSMSSMPSVEPDNPFLLKYVVYHHFRSLGWVVRPGIKFAVDYLLYIRGPAFTHAEFAIMIIPSYSAPYWTERADGDMEPRGSKKERKDWWWLHRVNRVQTQVMKTLMLVYVEVPAPWDAGVQDEALDIGSTLKKYTVREFILKRWSPSRNRD
jgi:tRNA-splicing endonuclease subunit Sen2